MFMRPENHVNLIALSWVRVNSFLIPHKMWPNLLRAKCIDKVSLAYIARDSVRCWISWSQMAAVHCGLCSLRQLTHILQEHLLLVGRRQSNWQIILFLLGSQWRFYPLRLTEVWSTSAGAYTTVSVFRLIYAKT